MWCLSVLGEPCLTTPGGRVRARPGPKGWALLACLAMAPDLRMGRAALAALLWSDAMSTSAARHALRQCLLRLKAQLGPAAQVLGADDDAVWLDRSRVSVDVIEVQAALRAGTPGALVAASRATGGRFCAGLDVGLAEFEDWLRDRQRDCDRLCADLHGKAAAILAERGDGDGAIAAARRRLECEPYQDDAHAALIALCIRFGRRQEATLAHAACHQLYRKDLCVPPAPEVDDALRLPVPASRALAARPLPVGSGSGSRSGLPALRAFAAGVAAAAVLFQVTGPWRPDQTATPRSGEMSIWVGPAPANAAQGAAFGNAAAGSSGKGANDHSQIAIRRMLDGDTEYAMLYPAGC